MCEVGCALALGTNGCGKDAGDNPQSICGHLRNSVMLAMHTSLEHLPRNILISRVVSALGNQACKECCWGEKADITICISIQGRCPVCQVRL